MVLDCIKDHDSGLSSSERRDFLAFLCQEQKFTGEPMDTRELMNHLMNNLYAPTLNPILQGNYSYSQML